MFVNGINAVIIGVSMWGGDGCSRDHGVDQKCPGMIPVLWDLVGLPCEWPSSAK